MLRRPALLLLFTMLTSLMLYLVTNRVMVQAAPEQTIVVRSTLMTDSECTLPDAIRAANTDSAQGGCIAGNGADTITFNLLSADGTTILLQEGLGGGELPAIAGTLTIDGSMVENLTIDGEGESRIFKILEGATVTMTHLTLTNGFVEGPDNDGGAIYNERGALALIESTLEQNGVADANNYGGAIYNYSGTLAVRDSAFSYNGAKWSGGGAAIYNTLGVVTVESSTFNNNAARIGGAIVNAGATAVMTITNSILHDNSSGWGGAVHNREGFLTVSDSTIEANFGGDEGGGIYNDGTLTVKSSVMTGNLAYHGGAISSTGPMTVTNSMLRLNQAKDSGGGIYNDGGTLTVGNSTFDSNSATYGAGLLNFGIASVSASTLSGNSAELSAGGIDNAGTLTLTNSTLSANSATNEAGGIFNDWNGELTVRNSTLSGNSAPSGAGIMNLGTMAATNSIIANSPSGDDCRIDEDGTVTTFTTNIVEGGNCGDAITDDPLLGPLQDNGGLTFTHALPAGSPAIDAGDSDTCPETDQRRVERPLGPACDIGAFEFEPFTNYLPLLTVH